MITKKTQTSLIKPELLTGVLMFLCLTTEAQSVQAENGSVSFPEWLSNPIFWLVAGLFFMMLMVIYVLSKSSIGLAKATTRLTNKITVTVILLLTNAAAFSQTPEPASKQGIDFPEWASNPNVYILASLFFILLITIFALYRANITLLKIITPETVTAKEKTAEAVARKKKPTFLRRMYLRMVDSVPVAHEKDVLLDHDYDGIRELDNNLPPWWKYGFYVTIVFAVFYLLIYHVSGTGKLQLAEYKDELAQAAKDKEERMKASSENISEQNVVVLTNADALSNGKETFLKNCVACHRADGGGLVGPNLTDEFWLHGGGIKNIFKTITYGVPAKGMISWQSQLSPKQIQSVASYILTLKGSNPPGPKEPQGDKWMEEVVASADSISVSFVDTLKKK